MTHFLRILVAEDLPDSVEILKLAFEKGGVKAPVHYVKDGSETIEYLKGEGAFIDRVEHPLPTMLLLDLKMPGVGRVRRAGLAALPTWTSPTSSGGIHYFRGKE